MRMCFNNLGNNINVNTNGAQQTWIRPVIDVWPGDLDNSGLVDVSDILPIGYFYNQTGPVRPNANLSWTAQRSPLWGFDLSYSGASGYKTFADATGDGTINLSEQTAIGLNMTQTHNKNYTYQIPQYSTVSALPSFELPMPADTIMSSNLPQTVTVPISVGSVNDPVSGLYGVSIDLVYNPIFVNESSISINYSGSWFGVNGQDYISVENPQTGSFSVGMTRFGTSPLNGNGHLFDVSFELNYLDTNAYFRMDAIKLNATDDQGNQVDINNNADSVFITNGMITGVHSNPITQFMVYPNPFKNSTNVSFSRTIEDGMIEVYDLLGNLVASKSFTGNMAEINSNDLASGSYVVNFFENDQYFGRTNIVVSK